MEIVVLTGRVQHAANHFQPSVAKAIMDDYEDDIKRVQSRDLAPEYVARKWAAFVGLKYSGGCENGENQ